jgi:hypothetical protein
MTGLTSVTHLTLVRCFSRDVSKLFEYASMLIYLKVQSVSNYITWTNNDSRFSSHCAIHLKQLTLTDFSERFEEFETLAKQTPNLKSLMISSLIDEGFVDAPRWENLISSLFSQLTVFKFGFECDCFDKSYYPIIIDRFREFDSDFWR